MTISKEIPNLVSGRLLARNTIWNLIGQLVPMVIGMVAIPPLVRGLGIERFGLLSLIWIIIGYFSLFDLGLGRALTKLVSDKLGSNDHESIPSLAWSALFLMLLLGGVGGLVVLIISPWLVRDALKIPSSLQLETLRSFYLLAASMPIVIMTSGLRGILEAQQCFRVLNIIRIPTSVFSFVGPLLVLPFSHKLLPVIIVLVFGRFVGFAAHVMACLQSMPSLRRGIVLHRTAILPLVQFGGWMTVTNIIGPLMVYMDRFLIGALVSVSAIAYYTAPFDAILRLTILPGSAVGVLFPAFAVSMAQDPPRTVLLLRRGVKYVFLAVFPIVLIIVALAPEILERWLGVTFSQNGTVVLRLIAVGVFVNSLAQLPFALIQSAGRPDITAKVVIAELPVYLAALWFLTKKFGIEGTAIAWTGRITVDAILYFLFAHRLLPHQPRYLPKLCFATVASLAMLFVATIPQSMAAKALFLIPTLVIFGCVGWFWGLAPVERSFIFRTRGKISMKAEVN
jgi:O-antigen/teichoic acid export membrane protein